MQGVPAAHSERRPSAADGHAGYYVSAFESRPLTEYGRRVSYWLVAGMLKALTGIDLGGLCAAVAWEGLVGDL